MLKIVAGVITKDDKTLICKRPKDKSNGLLWEFAGGKVEKGETLQDALIRECLEELDVRVEVKDFIMRTEYSYPDVDVEINFFYSEIKEGKEKCLEHSEIKWVDFNELSDFQFCPADKDIVKFLMNNRGLNL